MELHIETMRRPLENVANFAQYRYPSNLMSTATERVARPCCRACLNSLWCCYRAHLLYSFCRTVRFPPATLPLAGTVLTVLPCSRAEATLVGTNKISCMRLSMCLTMVRFALKDHRVWCFYRAHLLQHPVVILVGAKIYYTLPTKDPKLPLPRPPAQPGQAEENRQRK